MFNLFYILILINNAFSQQFEAKRDLIESQKSENKQSFMLGVGLAYSINVLQQRDENFNCNCIYQGYFQDNNLVPSIFSHYKYDKNSNFGFRLNISYFNQKFNKDRFETDVVLENDDIGLLVEDRNFDIKHYDIDFTVHYNPLGFKQIELFAGLKNRAGEINYNFNKEVRYGSKEILLKENQKFIDNSLKLNYIVGLNYNGKISNFFYNLAFQYNSSLNEYNLNTKELPKYKLTSFGIGFNLLYEM